MSWHGSEAIRIQTMTGGVGGGIILPATWKSLTSRIIPLALFQTDQIHSLARTVNCEASPLSWNPFWRSGVSNPHRLA